MRGGTIAAEDNITINDKARIAVYDDLLSAPRVVDIQPQGVHEFIEAIASATYELSHQQGGTLPYTVIREITENFIHAGFLECTVSILDRGNTLRFADQGPGITKKDLVLQPGVSSATRNMKDYIRGVGSGFPIVREYLSSSRGCMSIEDNAEDGVIVTITGSQPSPSQTVFSPAQNLSTQQPVVETEALYSLAGNFGAREDTALLLLKEHGMLGPVDLAHLLNVSAPTATRLLQKLEQLHMVESTQLKKRILSNVGMAYVQELLIMESSR